MMRRGLPSRSARLVLAAALFGLTVGAVVRSFAWYPLRVTSNSMLPTVAAGDWVVVAARRPRAEVPIDRGDIVLFTFPFGGAGQAIKRVVAVPGDEVAYLNQQLSINGKPIPLVADGEYYDDESMRYARRFGEKLGEVSHRVLVEPRAPTMVRPMDAFRAFRAEGVACKVPAGHYFVMGDNRDNSQDSRFWGFVPDANIVGKAFFVWMNFGNLRRIGSFD
jgi:signal peptidase I